MSQSFPDVTVLLQANAIRLEALWAYLYHEDAAMEQLQQDALKAAYSAFTARNALNIGEQAESRPGQDNLLNMTIQQVECALHCCCVFDVLCLATEALPSNSPVLLVLPCMLASKTAILAMVLDILVVGK